MENGRMEIPKTCVLQGHGANLFISYGMATTNTAASDGHPTTHIRNFLFGQTGMSTKQYLAGDQRPGGRERQG
jgi:hypothetical protein